MGLSVAQLTQGTIVANLGFGEAVFPEPLFHGDTLYAEFSHVGRNQHGDVVATTSRKAMVRKRPEGDAQ